MARRFQLLIALSVVLSAAIGAGACGSNNNPKIAVQVAPLCIEVPPGGSQQFDATIFIDDVDQGIDNAAVDWSVLGGDVNGVITNSGLYTAPNTNPPPAVEVTIIATSTETNQSNKQGQATVVLSGTCPVVPPPSETF